MRSGCIWGVSSDLWVLTVGRLETRSASRRQLTVENALVSPIHRPYAAKSASSMRESHLRTQITPCTFEDFELPFLMKCFVCDYSWQSLSGYSCRKCKIKFFSINSKHRAARNLTIGLCCAHSLVFGLKIAPFWMWRMYAMGETLNFMDIVVLWRFGRWIGDTRAFSTVNWRLDAERVSSLPSSYTFQRSKLIGSCKENDTLTLTLTF